MRRYKQTYEHPDRKPGSRSSPKQRRHKRRPCLPLAKGKQAPRPCNWRKAEAATQRSTQPITRRSRVRIPPPPPCGSWHSRARCSRDRSFARAWSRSRWRSGTVAHTGPQQRAAGTKTGGARPERCVAEGWWQRLQNTVFGIEHGLAAAAAEQESSRVRPRNYFFAEFAFIRGEPAAKRYSDPTL